MSDTLHNNHPKEEKKKNSNFIKEIIAEDLLSGKNHGRLATRFPPEPNGYLHIGHAKSICLNFGIANDNKGATCNLRFDDTNPSKEDVEYVDSIKEDVRWLGFDWEDRLYFASDYFEKLYDFALQMVKSGSAFVCSMTDEEIKDHRGNFYTKAKPSPYRDRTVQENLELFEAMRAGKFKDGECVLRAKVDLESSNMNMRDPVIYRIRHANHHRTGDKWCIYPMYDFAHGLSDAIERITHSLCTLEFEDHRPLYDWFLIELGIKEAPRQIEFARLNLSYTVLSKRKLLELVEGNYVNGWDDPRMPTISGLRRRGYTAKSIKDFCDRIGVAKADSMVDIALLEHCLREDLNDSAKRVMGVLNPLRLVITNYPENESEEFDAPYHPGDPSMGSRKVPFSRVLYVERDDFKEEAPRKWHRLAPGKEVRLRYACLITCDEVIKDARGEVVELRCSYDPHSRGGTSPDGRKVRGTLHWVSADHAVDAKVRLYDRLFVKANPMAANEDAESNDFKLHINPDSLKELSNCKLEKSLADASSDVSYQFERLGYFCLDPKDQSDDGMLVFNRTVSLRDSWARIEKQQKKQNQPKQKKSKPKYIKPIMQDDRSPLEDEIKIDSFQKLDFRVGLVLEATIVEKADKLIKLMVDVGEDRPRQIFSGIRSSYPDPAVLLGKQVIVVANLKPRKMKFGMSEGMVLAGGDGDNIVTASFGGTLKPGDKVT